MRKIKKVVALTMASVLSVGTLAGCGKSEGGGKNGEDQITLTVLTGFQQENPEPPAIAWKEMKEKFLKENPNVKIEEETIGATDALNKLKTQIATGNLPDVFVAGISTADTFVDSGYSPDLNDFIANDFDVEFNEGAVNDLTVDGTTYAIPYATVTNSNIIYNEKIFEECGITEFPKTLDEFEEALQKIKDKGYIPICAGDKDNWYLDICLFREIANRYCGEDWAVSIDKNDGAKFTDPEFIKALEVLKDWYDKGFFNEDIMSLNFLQHRQYYFEGKAAMYFDGSGGIPPVVEECPKEVLDVTEIAALPSLDGSKVVTGTANWGITYNNKLKGKKLEAAQNLIKTFCSKEGAQIIFENGGTAAINTEYDKEKVPEIMQKYNTMMSETKIEKMFTNAPSIANVMDPGLQDMLIGNITPKELAESLEAEHQKLFE